MRADARRQPRRIQQDRVMAFTLRCVGFVVTMTGLIVGGCARDENKPLRVLAASSLTDVLSSTSSAFQTETGIPVTLSFGATSRLVVQIQNGMPADVFISADEQWHDALVQSKRIDDASTLTLFGNALVLAVPRTTPDDVRALSPSQLLRSDAVVRIGLAGPAVPAGRYAREALEHHGVLDDVKSKFVDGDNVRTVLAWLRRGEVDAAIVYATDVKNTLDVVVVHTFSADAHRAIEYRGATVTTSSMKKAAERFLQFYACGAGRIAALNHGFTVPTRPSCPTP